MREVVDRTRLDAVIDALGRAADRPTRLFLVGGCTAVLYGWRDSTVDVDVVMRPENDAVFRAIPEVKESLAVNIELASPIDFIPVPDGWESRSVFVRNVGEADFFHFDLYAQAMAKVERGHPRDLDDVRAMLSRDVISAGSARAYFARIEPWLYRFPAIDPNRFRRAVDSMFAG